MKKGLLFIIALISFMVITACGDGNESSGTDDSGDAEASDEEKTYAVGATQIVEHPSLDAAYEGFQNALADADLSVEYDLQSAQGDQNNVTPIAENFVADQVDLIFANSTPSALGAVQATEDIPILFTSVTDAVEAGLVESMEQPGGNATGVVDLHPDAVKNTVQFIADNFDDAQVGLIYNAGEQNSVTQIEAVKKAADGTNLSFAERTVANSAEVQQATQTLVSKVDVFYIITDNTVVSALDSVVGVANEQDIPMIVGEPDSLKKGGFATYGIDYEKIGYRTGEMAVEILKGNKKPNDIAVEYPQEMQLFINKQAAEEQGVEWNDEWDENAKILKDE
ncbi:ABC transporter substrate-binding protein [Lentibacillus cibarius]|uniref:ABC transporter substrate-binding protein n=1 Tax=Lentibacillus cibarius TaxID=2583219 RepID=A0A549YEK1_9BACI|nr:ABC transporter substrate-binding protein [Lentibacillus cibarius]TMN21409.1 ABC transporter substrate-binding protein [Lentibacillus cibarius]TRM10288.1 ABC transporter substrate-binding protein [Lentibacillus cibarius]